jgi:hypothetical protein
LWHTEVEGASPATIAPLLGLTPNGVAALAYRAREGLRQAYLRLHLPAAGRPGDCQAATDKLAGWVRRSISEPQQRKINAHLSRCPRCRELAAGLTEVNGELRADVGPVMSWLSVLKGALSATTVKLGAAAAIAAVTAVGVVASEPAGPLGDTPGQVIGAAPALPETTLNRTETQVRTGAPSVMEPTDPARGAQPEQPGQPEQPQDRPAQAAPEAAKVKPDPPSAVSGKPPDKPGSHGRPADKPEKPAMPELPVQAKR